MGPENVRKRLETVNWNLKCEREFPKSDYSVSFPYFPGTPVVLPLILGFGSSAVLLVLEQQKEGE